MGKHVGSTRKDRANACQFALKYPGWHSYANDKTTLAVIRDLETLGAIETNDYRQFILKDSEIARHCVNLVRK
jgi:hypothetical protein